MRKLFIHAGLLIFATGLMHGSVHAECRSSVEARMQSLPKGSRHDPKTRPYDVLDLHTAVFDSSIASCQQENICDRFVPKGGVADYIKRMLPNFSDPRYAAVAHLQGTAYSIAEDYASCFEQQFHAGAGKKAPVAAVNTNSSTRNPAPPRQNPLENGDSPASPDDDKNKKSSKPMDECIVTSQRWSGDFYNAGSTNNCGVPLRVYACLVEPGHASSCKDGRYPAEGTGFIVHSSRQGDRGVINYMAGRDINMNRKGSSLQLYWFACRDPDKPQRIAEKRYKCVDFFAK